MTVTCGEPVVGEGFSEEALLACDGLMKLAMEGRSRQAQQVQRP